MINNRPRYLINLDLLQKYHFMLLDLDTCLNKLAFRYYFERNTNSLKHVSNHNQKGKFDLNLKGRERRNVGSLGIFGKQRDNALQNLLESWRSQPRSTIPSS